MFDRAKYIHNESDFVFEFEIEERKDKVRKIATYLHNKNGEDFRTFHKALNKEFERVLPSSDLSYAYKKKTNIKNALDKHIGSNVFIKLDIKEYFNSITFEKLMSKLKGFSFTEDDIRCCFFKGNLPIGFVSSPKLSDYYLYDFDKKVEELVKNTSIVYSRYADDILISSKETTFSNLESIFNKIVDLLNQEGLSINPKKVIHYDLSKQTSARFLGVNIGKDKLTISKKALLSIIKTINLALKTAKEGKKSLDFENYKASALGQIEFVKSISTYSYYKLLKKIQNCCKVKTSFLKNLKFERKSTDPLYAFKQNDDKSKYLLKNPAYLSLIDKSSLYGQLAAKVTIYYPDKDEIKDYLVISDRSKYKGSEEAISVEEFRFQKNFDSNYSYITSKEMKFSFEYHRFFSSIIYPIDNVTSIETLLDEYYKMTTTVYRDPKLYLSLLDLPEKTHDFFTDLENSYKAYVDLVNKTFDIRSDQFSIVHGMVIKYLGNDKNVIVPEGVVGLQNYCFEKSFFIESLTLPSSLKLIISPFVKKVCGYEYLLKEIRVNSLDDWMKIEMSTDDNPLELATNILINGDPLVDLVIPGKYKIIPQGRFINLLSLKTVVIEEGVELLSSGVFQGCLNLESVKTPKSLKTIGNPSNTYLIDRGCFHRCIKLTKIELQEGLETINREQFNSLLSLKEIALPSSLKHIDREFFNTGLVQLSIPSSVETVGDYCLNSNNSLKSITFQEGVKTIGTKVLTDCPKLETVILPDSVESIDSEFCINTPNLKLVEFDNAYYLGTKSNPYFVLIRAKSTDIESCIIHKDCKIINGGQDTQCHNADLSRGGFISCSKLKTITIPAGVRKLCENSFSDCTSLEKVTYEGNKTEIDKNAFDGCDKLPKVSLEHLCFQIEVSNGYFERILINHIGFYSYREFKDHKGRDVLVCSNGCQDSWYSDYQLRTVLLVLYKEFLAHSYDQPKNVPGEIKIKTFKSKEVSRKYPVTIDDLKNLDDSSYKYFVPTDEFNICLGAYLSRKEEDTLSLKPQEFDSKIRNQITKKHFSKFLNMSNDDLNSAYKSCLNEGDAVGVEEIEIFKMIKENDRSFEDIFSEEEKTTVVSNCDDLPF